jgi:hypothetical protein
MVPKPDAPRWLQSGVIAWLRPISPSGGRLIFRSVEGTRDDIVATQASVGSDPGAIAERPIRAATARLFSRCLSMMMKVVIRFVLLSIAYLVFAGQTSTDECVAAVLSAGLLIGLWLVARFWQTQPLSFAPAVVLRLVLAVAPKLLTDSLRLVPRMLSGRTGETSQEFVAGASAPQDVAWWAVFTLTTSVSPNNYLITRLPRPGEVVMHRLVESSGP